jgi:hypothetical protein
LNAQLIKEMEELKVVGTFDSGNTRRGDFETVKHGIQMGAGSSASAL